MTDTKLRLLATVAFVMAAAVPSTAYASPDDSDKGGYSEGGEQGGESGENGSEDDAPDPDPEPDPEPEQQAGPEQGDRDADGGARDQGCEVVLIFPPYIKCPESPR